MPDEAIYDPSSYGVKEEFVYEEPKKKKKLFAKKSKKPTAIGPTVQLKEYLERAAEKEYDSRFEKLIHKAAGTDYKPPPPQPARPPTQRVAYPASYQPPVPQPEQPVYQPQPRPRRRYMPPSPHCGKPGWLGRPPIPYPEKYKPFKSAPINPFRDQYRIKRTRTFRPPVRRRKY